MCMRAATQKFKMNPFQQSHFRQKEENELGNEINNGDLKHLLPKKKKKVMFTKCHIHCPEDLIPLRSMHNKQQNKLPQT